LLSGNGSAYRSKPWRQAFEALGLTPKRTRPYTPHTNGKAERLIKTLVSEGPLAWAHRAQQSEIAGWGDSRIYNPHRCHIALAGGRTPYQQLAMLRITE